MKTNWQPVRGVDARSRRREEELRDSIAPTKAVKR
jgi:hypothetical protein